jgi:hypothetical protein
MGERVVEVVKAGTVGAAAVVDLRVTRSEEEEMEVMAEMVAEVVMVEAEAEGSA